MHYSESESELDFNLDINSVSESDSDFNLAFMNLLFLLCIYILQEKLVDIFSFRFS